MKMRHERARKPQDNFFLLGLLLVVAASLFCEAVSGQSQYDLLIRHGRLLDGTGNPWYYADVAITGDRIVAVGDLSGTVAGRVIDADGLYVAPGFIDVHSHAGPGLASPQLSAAQPLLAQGITTVIVNPDGEGPADLAEQRVALLKDGLGVNVAQLVPHGAIRRQIVGLENRPPSREELEEMKALVRAGMKQGAFGLSSGPFYAPGSFATTEELVELAKEAAAYGGVYTSHIRDESDYSIGLVAAVDEVIRIVREAKLPGIVSHIKALGPHVWGYSMALIERIERARDEGAEIFADQYPYNASATGLGAALLPRWVEEGGRDRLLERISDPELLPQIRAAMEVNLERRGGAGRIMFRRSEADPSLEGKTLEQVANERGLDPLEVALDMIRKNSRVGIISFNMQERDVRRLMSQPWTMTSSDGGLTPFGEGLPHPRDYGAFTRKIRKYVKEDGVISLSFAIHSMTGLPATVFQIKDRGIIRPGAIADLVVFDLERLQDKADYQRPHQLSEGMLQVLVNGRFAIQDRRFQEELHGKVLRRDQALQGFENLYR